MAKKSRNHRATPEMIILDTDTLVNYYIYIYKKKYSYQYYYSCCMVQILLSTYSWHLLLRLTGSHAINEPPRALPAVLSQLERSTFAKCHVHRFWQS
jgi:hypothetical protein